MAFSKASHFNSLTYEQSIWSKALAHPARIIILTHLLENGTTPFQKLTKLIPLSRSTISQHLRLLRQTGLIDASEHFPYTYYQIRQNTCKELAEKIKTLHQSFAKK